MEIQITLLITTLCILMFLAGISYSESSIKRDLCSLKCSTLECVNTCASNSNIYDLIRNNKCKE